MLSIKDFEKQLKTVTQEAILKKKVRGQYIPYIEMMLKKARLCPVGRSVEIDVQDPKKAFGLAQATRAYLTKLSMDDQFTAGHYKTSVFCGKRSSIKPEKAVK